MSGYENVWQVQAQGREGERKEARAKGQAKVCDVVPECATHGFTTSPSSAAVSTQCTERLQGPPLREFCRRERKGALPSQLPFIFPVPPVKIHAMGYSLPCISRVCHPASLAAQEVRPTPHSEVFPEHGNNPIPAGRRMARILQK